MAGAPIAYVSRQLRHSDIRITSEVYAHLSPEFRHAEADKLKLGGDAPELLEPLRAMVNSKAQGPYGVQGTHQTTRSQRKGPDLHEGNRGLRDERRTRIELATPRLGTSSSAQWLSKLRNSGRAPRSLRA